MIFIDYLCVLFGQTNASSGMGVADHCKSTYLELQRKKVHRYVIFKIDEKKKEVVVEKTGGPAESYDDFTASLPENDCRYAVYDYDFVTSENCQKSKIFFFAWSVLCFRYFNLIILLLSYYPRADKRTILSPKLSCGVETGDSFIFLFEVVET